MAVDARIDISELAPRDAALLRSLGEVARARGVRAYIVGGVVRDLLLGVPTSDLDVVVEDRAEAFAAAALEALGGSYKTYARFGTALFLPGDGTRVDIATARSETYASPGALPNVDPGTIGEDLVRRDFTINAMAASILAEDEGRLIDEHGGLEDLRDGTLRVLHDRSFLDDPTRLLRAVRFQARFGFAIEPLTDRLLESATASRALDTVTGERIMNEINLIVAENRPEPALLTLVDRGLTAAIEACWRPERGRVASLLDALDGAPEHGRRALILALLEPVRPACRDRVADRLRAGRRLRAAIRDLVLFDDVSAEALASARPPRSEVHRLLRGHSTDVLALAVARDPGGAVASMVRLYLEELAGVEIALSGADLIELGFQEGEKLGRALDALRRARLDGFAASREDEERLAKRLLDAEQAVLDEDTKSC